MDEILRRYDGVQCYDCGSTVRIVPPGYREMRHLRDDCVVLQAFQRIAQEKADLNG
jgi:hypothetical protein